MNHEAMKATVYDVLRSKAPFYSGAWRDDTPLGYGGLHLDSIGCLEVVLMLEKRTGISIRNEHLTADVLQTAGSLVDFLAHAAGDAPHG